MIKIWSGVFWSPAEEAPDVEPHRVGRLGGPVLMIAPTAALAALSVVIALAAGPLYALSERAAADVLDPRALRRGGAGPMSRLALGAMLLAVWLLLWGSASPTNILSGLAIVGLLFVVVPSSRRMLPSRLVHPWGLLKLGGWFAMNIVTSNVVLSWAILSPGRTCAPAWSGCR